MKTEISWSDFVKSAAQGAANPNLFSFGRDGKTFRLSKGGTVSMVRAAYNKMHPESPITSDSSIIAANGNLPANRYQPGVEYSLFAQEPTRSSLKGVATSNIGANNASSSVPKSTRYGKVGSRGASSEFGPDKRMEEYHRSRNHKVYWKCPTCGDVLYEPDKGLAKWEQAHLMKVTRQLIQQHDRMHGSQSSNNGANAGKGVKSV